MLTPYTNRKDINVFGTEMDKWIGIEEWNNHLY